MKKWVSAAVVPIATLAVLTPTAAASGQLTLSLPVGSYGQESNNVDHSGGVLRLGTLGARAASAHEPSRTGLAVYEPNKLAEAVNTVSAKVTATVPAATALEVDVRGTRADGNWTEWTPVRGDAPAVLPVRTSTVQVRLVLTAPDGVAGPEVRAVDLTFSSSPAAASAAVQDAGLSYRIFATREGLTGHQTANGHIIKSRDHFVALPSGRSLSGKNTGTYSVQLCTTTRCAWAPVWDKGPWNITDDYWNPASVRQSWTDLPQGKPEAQAAYQDGYNGGRNAAGTRVANPAGIDLGDGTFWDGLKLADNSWVTVTFLWTGSGPGGFVRSDGDPVNVRAGTTLSSTVVGLAGNHAQVRVQCQTTGAPVTGSQGTSSTWYRIAPDKYISAAYVNGVTGATAC